VNYTTIWNGTRRRMIDDYHVCLRRRYREACLHVERGSMAPIALGVVDVYNLMNQYYTQ
jgi:hypothetical protein